MTYTRFVLASAIISGIALVMWFATIVRTKPASTAGKVENVNPHVLIQRHKTEFPVHLADRIISLGKCHGGATRQFAIELVNQGDSNATIVEVLPSCGCIFSEHVNSTIRPGGSSVIEGRIKLPYEIGRIDKSVTVRVAYESENLTYFARDRAVVLPPDGIRAVPATLKFLGESSDEVVTRSFVLMGLEREAEVECTINALTGFVTVKPMNGSSDQSSELPGRTISVFVNLSRCKAGQHVGNIRCMIDGHHDVLVPVRVKVRAQMNDVKDCVVISGLHKGETKVVSLLLNVRSDRTGRGNHRTVELARSISNGVRASVDSASLAVKLTRDVTSSNEDASMFIVNVRNHGTRVSKRVPVIVRPGGTSQQLRVGE